MTPKCKFVSFPFSFFFLFLYEMASKVLQNYLNNIPIGKYNLNKTSIGEYNKKKEFQPICVPTVLIKDDAETWLDVCSNGLKVVYNGPGRTNVHAAAIRANYPMPIEAGLYYFEVDIIDKGEFGYIGVGFGEPNVSINRLPGWDYKSFGYHGDDGMKFSSSGVGVSYGPLFTTGDTIGVGINFFNRTAFYTKNGIHIGTAFENVEGNLYPMIGLRSRGEIVEANFGRRPFKFDIDYYAQSIFDEIKENEVLEQEWVDRIIGGDNNNVDNEEISSTDFDSLYLEEDEEDAEEDEDE
ncbi:hypothetical protein Glove_80g44 [Diversispora epigaea]|uniref:B30.2/SPRY domain-containing protein n=1 Tax=Diversispora epigaea TaxID=1348612 RepID=A0A397J846_9GLOM|nr:hypothetical protein Glove_80g44 [Diversispora epigaea]